MNQPLTLQERIKYIAIVTKINSKVIKSSKMSYFLLTVELNLWIMNSLLMNSL